MSLEPELSHATELVLDSQGFCATFRQVITC